MQQQLSERGAGARTAKRATGPFPRMHGVHHCSRRMAHDHANVIECIMRDHVKPIDTIFVNEVKTAIAIGAKPAQFAGGKDRAR